MHQQVIGVDRVIASGSIGSVMVNTLVLGWKEVWLLFKLVPNCKLKDSLDWLYLPNTNLASLKIHYFS